MIYALAGEDYGKMEAQTERTVGASFTHMAFLKDLRYKQEKEMKKAGL
jgi:hypothetical protein